MLRQLPAFENSPMELVDELETHARAITDMLGTALRPSSDTPINGKLGPHRRVDWLTLPLEDVKAVRRTLQCTVNDVVLATVTGAVRHYLRRRGVDLEDLDFRVSAPVNMRDAGEHKQLGNRVSTWVVRLPVDEDDPRRWIEAVRKITEDLKRSKQALGADMMMRAAEYAPASLLALGARAASGPINMIVTNVPGPQFPLYTLGAKLLEMQPLVPLLDGTGLGVALFSYDGKLHVGLNAEYELVPDLSTFTALFAQSFMALTDAAGVGRKKPARSPDPLPIEADAVVPAAANEVPVSTIGPDLTGIEISETGGYPV